MLTKNIKIVKIKNGFAQELDDIVVAEAPIQITLNSMELATILASPYKEKELGVGFLFTEGFIDNVSDIREFKEEKNSLYFTIDPSKFEKEGKIQRYITSGCGRGTSFDLARKSLKKKKGTLSPIISTAEISSLMKDFQKKSELFLQTGGVHSAAICSPDKIFFFSEDIGRHNAVDRVIGEALLSSTPLQDKILLTSGRISSEIVRKIAQAEIPVLISRSAPTERAISFANELQITVIGFARGNMMNIYGGPARVST